MRLDLLDVFAESPLSGNQLAVVRDADALTPDRMQAMALEMNFSETTFVVSESEDRARVRIFTPTQELPFAGHPALGTAWVLGHARDAFTLDLEAGAVRVEFRDGLAWMAPPPIELAETYTAAETAGWLECEVEDLHPTYPVQRGGIGLEFLLVGLRSVEALESLDMTIERLRALPSFGLFAFAEAEPGSGADFRARMYFESGGLREDPATGSANSIFATYLGQSRGPDFEARIDQGVEMGRPSRIYLRIENGSVQVGGKVQQVATGQWTLPR